MVMQSGFRAAIWGSLRGGLAALVLGVAAPAVAQVPKMVQVVAGSSHSCALDDAGHVWCWGFNDSGQLGDGTTTNRATPVDVVFPWMAR